MSAYRGFVIGTLFVAALMRPSPAAAQQPNSRVPVLIGQKVKITVADGRIVKGTVSSLTPASIELAGTRIAASDVRRVQLPDSLGDGAVKGALVCGLIGVVLGAAADGFGEGIVGFGGSYRVSTSYFLVGAGAGVVIGGVLGAAFDAMHMKTVYERGNSGMTVGLWPIVSQAGKGVGVSVRW